jgi:H+/Cl- antiporter ClcA
MTLGVASGLLAGGGAFVFLEGLDVMTSGRDTWSWLLWLLPAVGLMWGVVHQRLSTHDSLARATGGTSVVINEARRPHQGISPWQAPLVLVGTWAAHLTGASVGREGVGLQLSASLSEHVARWGRLDRDQRRVLLVGAIAGGFGAVFGVPWAGAVFALEVVGRPRRPLACVVVALIASFIGDQVVRRLGHAHAIWPTLRPGVDLGLALRVAGLGVLTAMTAWCFVTGVERLRSLWTRVIGVGALRPAVGGAATVALALVWGREYLGLSLPLLEAAVTGSDSTWTVPLLKVVFTVVA